MEIPPYSPGVNPIGNVWALVKDELQKRYPEQYLMKGCGRNLGKVIEETITHCWELSQLVT